VEQRAIAGLPLADGVAIAGGSMKVFRKWLAWLLLGLLLLPLSPGAQDAPKAFKPEELDQLMAPIALHPDQLVAQILMASTYPLEVVQAARLVKEKPDLEGDRLNDALKQVAWDDSVKSLVFFPQVLAMMNERLDWLQKVGDAFLGQQPDVMASIQRLRARAQAAGQLKSTPEQQIITEPSASAATSPASAPAPAGAPPATAPPTTVQVPPPTVIRIEPTDPQVVYVPSYNPTVVYGTWPPAYPPYYPYPAGYFAAGAFTFAAGAAVGAALWGGCNWGGGEVEINTSRVNNFTTNVNSSTEASKRVESYRNSGQAGQGQRQAQGQRQGQSQWQHNPEHRKGVQYRDTATQQRYNKTGPANAEAREAFRGRTTQGTEGARAAQSAGSTRAAQPGAGQPGARERQGGQQPSASVGERAGQGASRSGAVAQGGGGQTRQAGAFEGVSSGRDTQSFSNRGNASRQSFQSSTAGASRGGAAGGAGGGGRGGGRR
jgi:hypothetical protein